MPADRPRQQMVAAALRPALRATGRVETRFDERHASDDARLVRASCAGDRTAFERLYERYARFVHGILLSRVHRADVDDLLQEIFLAAWNRLDRLRDPAAFGGWIAMIARNRATDHHRQATEHVGLPDTLAAQDSTAERAEANAALAAIQQLPPAYRETLVLRLVEGLTGPEIAERTGLTAASVRVNLHRGMKMLRERLNQ